jgi:hypothetical protein
MDGFVWHVVDMTSPDEVYEATIGPFGEGTSIQCNVLAQDTAGNLATGETWQLPVQGNLWLLYGVVAVVAMVITVTMYLAKHRHW